ncbi:Isoflavone reductase-like [Vitis vinifera]|uniref:Isoflavone reductase-like n=1 Tax=Vitis vinifera TaxID=29760 RepID=A0A438GY70_VITVI|nr:Isoflavone reductase-like [Vitis vinifera]
MEKSKVLVVGGTGYIGRRMVKASLAQGHPTFVLQRPEIGMDIDKLQMLLSFKAKGATLVEGSVADHKSLLKLVDAIKEAGNIKRFLPSEFGMDPSRMGDALEPGRVSFDEKMIVRKAIEEAKIPHTYVSANCFAGYFVPNLSQMAALTPPKEKRFFVDEDDVATYAIKTIDDPRTLNKTVYIRPPENILSQRQIVEMWEKLTGKTLDKSSISKKTF